MQNETLKVPKKLHTITLWVHPEGRVSGSIYLREQSPDHAGSETPLEALNACQSFLVFKRSTPDQLRFYNLKSIIRIEYEASEGEVGGGAEPMVCHLQMMDGSLINGTIRESLPPDRARLLDYLNRPEDTFIKVHMEDKLVYLINKSYIINVHVAGIDDAGGED